jgi:hypothetical protein
VINMSLESFLLSCHTHTPRCFWRGEEQRAINQTGIAGTARDFFCLYYESPAELSGNEKDDLIS